MKTTVYSLLISAALLPALFSCQKELQDASEGPGPVEMSFTALTEGTRTQLSEDRQILWSAADDITVFAAGTGTRYTVSSVSDDRLQATFTGASSQSGVYYALFPCSATASIDAEGVVTTVLPSSQDAVAGSFGDKSNLSVARTDSHTLQFRNAGSLVAVRVGNSDLTGIRLEGAGGEALAGPVSIAYNDGEPQMTVTSAPETAVSLTGTFTAGKTYYFVVCPGSFPNGFRLTYYKEGYFASYVNSKAAVLERNGNLLLADFTVPDGDWRETAGFEAGDELTIRNSAEAGQKVSYISEGYWDASDGLHFSDNGDNYNYEIFTRLNAGEKFHFRSEGNYLFALNAGGDKVVPIGNASRAAYGAPADGIYRIRLNMSAGMGEGEAHIKQVSAVKYSQRSVFGADLEYAGNGVWTYADLPMRRNSQSWNNRYKFNVVFGDGTNQYYGRRSGNGGNPVYGTTGADYFYVQPCDNTDNWEPCFKFPSECEIDEDRYYGDLSLSFNNEGGHYTHAIVNVRDSRNLPDITPGEDVFIGGGEEAGMKLIYMSEGYYRSAAEKFGDMADLDPNAIGDYDYELYTYLKEGQKFWFYNQDGNKFFAPNATGDALVKVVSSGKAVYSVPGEGVWRIRANFATGKFSIRRIGIVHSSLLYTDGCSYNLNYAGRGVWQVKDQTITWGVQSWNPHVVSYRFSIWFNLDNAGDNPDIWQQYGSVTRHEGSNLPAENEEGSYWDLQPYTGDTWDAAFYYGKWLWDEDYNSCIATTVSLCMNADNGHITHRFSDTKYIGTGSGKMLFDFGTTATGNPTASPDKNGNGWNNIRITTSGGTGSGNGTVFSSLRYTNGVHCGYSLVLKTDFKSNSNGGLTEAMYTADTESALGELAIGTATGDYFHNDSASNRMTFELQGLDPAAGYRFTFFGSRTGSAGQTRHTRYYVDGQTSWYGDLITVGPDASQNTDQVVVSDAVRPTAAGTISISFGKGSTTSGDIYQLNCMKMEEIR